MTIRTKNRFGMIEIGRGVAASLVVFYHAGNIMSQPRFYGAEPFAQHLRNFNVGVDFFFVLSGFIITWVHLSDLGNRSSVVPYAIKRFLRIYPPYWGVLFPLIALYFIFPAAGVPSQRDLLNIVTSIFLLPNTSQPVLGVAWTLVHEIFFYAFFAVIIASGRAGLWLLPAWGAAIVVGHLEGPLDFPLSFLLSPFNIEFIFGVGAALLLKSRGIPLPGLVASAGAVCFVALMFFATHLQDDPLIGRLGFGVPSILFILGAVELERRSAIRLHPVLAYFGAASYAVYLVHPVALSFSIHAVSRIIGRSLPLEAVALFLASAGIIAGLAYHGLLEAFLVDWWRRRLQRFVAVGRKEAATDL
jgi:exopolysaccharide production protein ExoZ